VESAVVENFSKETTDLFEAADRAIAQSRELVAQRRQIISDAAFFLSDQEMLRYSQRATFLHGLYGKRAEP
jgi:hypothetical protein